MISGVLGKSKYISGKCQQPENNIEQVFNWIDKHQGLGKKVFIDMIPQTDYFLYGYDTENILHETNLPMYIQVIDQSNIKLYDMVKQRGGQLIARKVDCAVIHYKDNNIPQCIDGKEWGEYKECAVPTISNYKVY